MVLIVHCNGVLAGHQDAFHSGVGDTNFSIKILIKYFYLNIMNVLAFTNLESLFVCWISESYIVIIKY